MPETLGAVDRRGWHQALGYAVSGRRLPELGEQDQPAHVELAEQLRVAAAADLHEHVRSTLAAGQPWPHPVPPDLMAGLGYAQFAAALGQLRVALDLNGRAGVAAEQDPATRQSVVERRLLDEVPPHHGSV